LLSFEFFYLLFCFCLFICLFVWLHFQKTRLFASDPQKNEEEEE